MLALAARKGMASTQVIGLGDMGTSAFDEALQFDANPAQPPTTEAKTDQTQDRPPIRS
jgi:hypothetical protein